ncbi:MAG TPA: LysM peptidoglycan-binding domain-containing protein, partial [Burkholderiales bacterium]|nr:LysM peptidoglycan-binding domain-containing protein [Burkholderiales bacterium]
MTRRSISVFLAWALAASIVAGCTARRGAPVVDRSPTTTSDPARPSIAGKPAPRPADERPDFHTVRRGDTLYSIALDHGLDYRELALWNGITDTGAIRSGQQLRLKPPPSAVTAAPFKTAPGVRGRPIGEAIITGDVKTQPKAVRAPYSEQAYAQLASV